MWNTSFHIPLRFQKSTDPYFIFTALRFYSYKVLRVRHNAMRAMLWTALAGCLLTDVLLDAAIWNHFIEPNKTFNFKYAFITFSTSACECRGPPLGLLQYSFLLQCCPSNTMFKITERTILIFFSNLKLKFSIPEYVIKVKKTERLEGMARLGMRKVNTRHFPVSDL